MVVVDGRTDKDKLKELLSVGAECTELDFKETLDLRTKRDELDFVKDAVSMFNHFPGGYIIVGATDDGKPSPRAEGTDWSQFDGSKLTDKIKKYVGVTLAPVSAVHELDGHTYCLICFQSLGEGLPVPFSQQGQFNDGTKGGKQVVVFRRGEFSRRGGASNRPIEYGQWAEILQEHDRAIRSDESKRINDLVDRITSSLGERGKTPPLIYGVDDKALESALQANCNQGEEAKLKRFIGRLGIELQTSSDVQEPVEALTAVAAQALVCSLDSTVLAVIDTLYNWYLSIDTFNETRGDRKLALANACYEIGANIVLAQKWQLINRLVNRTSTGGGTNYIYASWVRECQVAASRANKFDKDHPGMMISQACERMCKRPLLMPGIEQMSNDERRSDFVLNLLCQFDFLFCLVVYTAGEGEGDAYPACVAFSKNRISGILPPALGGNDDLRRVLLPGESDKAIAAGLKKLCGVIDQQSMQASRYWWRLDLDPTVMTFLEANCG